MISNFGKSPDLPLNPCFQVSSPIELRQQLSQLSRVLQVDRLLQQGHGGARRGPHQVPPPPSPPPPPPPPPPRITTQWTFRPPKVHIGWRGVSWAERWPASQASGEAGLAEVVVGWDGEPWREPWRAPWQAGRCVWSRGTGERPDLRTVLCVEEDGAADRWISETGDGGRLACKEQL